MKLIDFFISLFTRAGTFVENVSGAFKQGAFLGADHCGMHPEALGQFSGGLFVL